MWFVDETISSDGFLYVGTPFDPLFLVLRFFHLKGENLFKNLDDLLFENATEVSLSSPFLSFFLSSSL